jgi:hypothetical protein
LVETTWVGNEKRYPSFSSVIFTTSRRKATLILPAIIIGFGTYLKSQADQ